MNYHSRVTYHDADGAVLRSYIANTQRQAQATMLDDVPSETAYIDLARPLIPAKLGKYMTMWRYVRQNDGTWVPYRLGHSSHAARPGTQ